MNNQEQFYQEAFARSAIVMGQDALNKLYNSSVCVCGLGGVGSYAAIALARSGVGKITICDNDVIVNSNINRQIHAGIDTLGQYKTHVMKRLIQNINPFCDVTEKTVFLDDSNISDVISGCCYVIDAIDSVNSKLALIQYACENSVNIISCMGAGNKLYPERLEIADIYETSVCPLAKIMRSELRKRGVPSLKVCYSKETPTRAEACSTVGSVSFVPPAAGFMLAAVVIRELGIQA